MRRWIAVGILLLVGTARAETGEGSLLNPPYAPTSMRESSTRRRTRSVTLSPVSPGKIRKFTTARVRAGRTLSFPLPSNMVGAIVVRSMAAVEGAHRPR